MSASASTAEALRRGHEVIAIARDVSKLDAAAGGDAGPGRSHGQGSDRQGDCGRRCGGAFGQIPGPRRRRPARRARRGAKRLLIVGGAASLYVAPGLQLIDTEGFPDFIKVEAEPARQALARIQRETALDWTFLSPSVFFGPGERTGRFRLGKDESALRCGGQEPYQLRGLCDRPARRDRAAPASPPALHRGILRWTIRARLPSSPAAPRAPASARPRYSARRAATSSSPTSGRRRSMPRWKS